MGQLIVPLTYSDLNLKVLDRSIDSLGLIIRPIDLQGSAYRPINLLGSRFEGSRSSHRLTRVGYSSISTYWALDLKVVDRPIDLLGLFDRSIDSLKSVNLPINLLGSRFEGIRSSHRLTGVGYSSYRLTGLSI